MIRELENFDKDVLKNKKMVLLKFEATWCAPCKKYSSTIKEIDKEIGDKIDFINIDVDKHQKIAEQHEIKGVPTIICVVNGKRKGQHFVGNRSADDLKTFIDSCGCLR